MVAAERTARARQFAPYFEAQLRFASRMAELTGSSLGDMAFQHTNLNRRFGLGFAGIVPPSEAWLDYAARLASAAGNRVRVLLRGYPSVNMVRANHVGVEVSTATSHPKSPAEGHFSKRELPRAAGRG